MTMWMNSHLKEKNPMHVDFTKIVFLFRKLIKIVFVCFKIKYYNEYMINQVIKIINIVNKVL